MPELTNAEIQAILQRAEAATLGPWTVDTQLELDEPASADQLFVLAARTDVPFLARGVLALRNERGELRESLRWALEALGDRYCGCTIYGASHVGDCPYARATWLLEEKP